MNWVFLIIAGLFEVGFATCLGKARMATGSASAWWMTGFFACLAVSMYLLYRATLPANTGTLPMGTAYAVWTGIGAVGTTLVGILLFSEPTDFWRMFFLFALIASIIGLKVVTQ